MSNHWLYINVTDFFLKFKEQDLALIQCFRKKELSYIFNFVVFEVVGWT